MPAKKNTTPQPTAAQTYAARRNDIARLLDVLGMELDKHEAKAKADPRNWGLTGDLDLIRKNLIETVAFMSGLEPERVTEFLNDAE